MEIKNLSLEDNTFGHEESTGEYEVAFFMELLESYRALLIEKGLNEGEIAEKLSKKTHINREAYYEMMHEYKELLQEAGTEEHVVEGNMGDLILAWNGFSPTFNQVIKPEHFKKQVQGEWQMDNWNKLKNQLIEWVEGAEAGENYEAERTLRDTLEKMKELEKAGE